MISLLLALCAATGALASLCHNQHAVSLSMHAAYLESLQLTEREDAVEYLFDLCSQDERCRRAYYMDLSDGSEENQRRQAFEYLVRHWADGASMASMAETFCAQEDATALRDQLWLAKLRLEAYESLAVRCGANERFVFVPSTMQGECICADEHNCQENGHLASEPLTLSTVALVLASVLVGFYVCVRIRNDRKLFEAFQTLRRECEDGCPHRRQLAERIKV